MPSRSVPVHRRFAEATHGGAETVIVDECLVGHTGDTAGCREIAVTARRFKAVHTEGTDGEHRVAAEQVEGVAFDSQRRAEVGGCIPEASETEVRHAQQPVDADMAQVVFRGFTGKRKEQTECRPGLSGVKLATCQEHPCVWVQLDLGNGGDASFRGLLIAGKTDEVSLATVHVAQVAVEVEEPHGVIDRLRQIYGTLDDVQLAPQVVVAPVDVGEQVERLELLLCLAGGTEDGKALFQPFPVGHCSIDGIDLASVRTRKSVAEASSVMGRSARESFVMRKSNSSGLFSRMSTLSSKAGSSLNGRRSHPIPRRGVRLAGRAGKESVSWRKV